ncbi:MAG: LON peptidase substrate-binding domain-containing protein [Bacteroidetes bacterium]|nr:LON peptidase substrate-binding domain-containing protein [Bacteroidota bacterium]
MTPRPTSFFLPLFPLNAVVFPKEKFNLHIFEPRYKDLIQHIKNGDGRFGLLPVLNGSPSEWATILELSVIETTYPDGSMDIKTIGQHCVRILEFFKTAPNASWPAGNVTENHELHSFHSQAEADPKVWEEFRESLIKLAHILNIPERFVPDSNYFASFQVAHYLNLPIEREFKLLTLPSETVRQTEILSHLREFLPNLVHREEIRKRVALNGHFKHIPPAEW